MQSINKINSTSIQVKSRSGNVLQLFLFAEKRLEFSQVRTRYKKQKFAPHFFCPNFGQKNNEDASLHFTQRSRSSLKSRRLFFTSSRKTFRLACEDVSFRYHSIALACHGVAKRRRVKLPPAAGGCVSFFTTLRLNSGIYFPA